MELPKISIVVPSYNKVKYIGQTLRSIFLQKYPNLEVIVQDGGSTDGTVEIIKKFAGKYHFAWQSKRDKGQLEAVNEGFKKATGQILAFINADDCHESGALAAVAKAYAENPGALWFAGKGIVVDGSGKEIAKPISWYKSLCLRLNFYFLLLIFNYLMQPSVFLTSKAYQKYGPFIGTTDFITEYDLWLKLGKTEIPVVLPQNLSKFRIEPLTKTKRLFTSLLSEDERIAGKYTENPLILFLHRLHNLGRILIGRFV